MKKSKVPTTKTKELTTSEKEGVAHMNKLEVIRLKNEFTDNYFRGRFFMARANMLADQLNADKIIESVDGLTKTKDYMIAEYMVMKKQAIRSLREAHFAKVELMNKYKLTQAQIQDVIDDYRLGGMVRDDYGEEYKRTKQTTVAPDTENT